MESAMWLIIWIREQLWASLPDSGEEGLTTRSKATLDVIHVLNEIVQWASRSHYGDSGEILPVASLERQAFYDVLTAAVGASVLTLEEWDEVDTDQLRKMVQAHVIGLDTVATMTLRPYYKSQIVTLAALVPDETGGAHERPGSGTAIPDDDR